MGSVEDILKEIAFCVTCQKKVKLTTRDEFFVCCECGNTVVPIDKCLRDGSYRQWKCNILISQFKYDGIFYFN
jgi:predicted RNA-binding Zn-ribbon protein involved in translation (DUF1610 family)